MEASNAKATGGGGQVLDTRNGSLLPEMPQAGALTRPLSHSPEPGDEGDPGRSGLELEPEEPPGWRELVPIGTLHSLPKSQVKRQEVISGEYRGHHPVLAERQGAVHPALVTTGQLEGSLFPLRAICYVNWWSSHSWNRTVAVSCHSDISCEVLFFFFFLVAQGSAGKSWTRYIKLYFSRKFWFPYLGSNSSYLKRLSWS